MHVTWKKLHVKGYKRMFFSEKIEIIKCSGRLEETASLSSPRAVRTSLERVSSKSERVSLKMRFLLLLLPLFSFSSSLSISFSPSKGDAKPLLGLLPSRRRPPSHPFRQTHHCSPPPSYVHLLPGVVYESLCPYSRQFIRLISHLTSSR